MITGDLDDVICPKQNDKEESNSNFHPHQDLLFIFWDSTQNEICLKIWQKLFIRVVTV